MTEEDPLSTQSISIHLLKLIIFLVGGCVLEGIKHTLEPPLVTNAILNLGEVTMLIYMVGALGQAFHWSWHQWSKGQPIFAAGGKSLLKQFLPQRIKLESVLRPPRFLLRLLVFIIAFLVVLALIEVTTTNSPSSLSQPAVVSSGSRKAARADDSVRLDYQLKQMRTDSFPSIFLSAFNGISVWMLGGVLILSAVAILSVAVVVIYNRRKHPFPGES
jgi:hypothetical protein